ncbi:MAG: hypothetical protein ACKOIA_03390 [Acidimicrobiia bacterium]
MEGGADAIVPSSRVRLGERRAVGDVLISSVLFGGCNIAWRYGTGPAIGIVGYRMVIGSVIAVGIARWRGGGTWLDPLRVRSGRIAVAASIAGLVAAGSMFRALDGPLAGLTLACTPAVALLVRDRSGRVAVGAALGSSAAAIVGLTVAAGDAGVASVSWGDAVIAVVFVAIDVFTLRALEVAVTERVDPMAIVSATMIGGAIVLVPFGLVLGAARDTETLGGALAAALAIALFGTVGRILRAAAQPAAGVTAMAASSQVVALVTALGGVVLFADEVTAVSAVCTAVAATLGAVAVVAGSRWRLRRDPALGASLSRADGWEDGPVEGGPRADA